MKSKQTKTNKKIKSEKPANLEASFNEAIKEAKHKSKKKKKDLPV